MLQIAVRVAGLRGKDFDGRYRLILGHYRQKDRSNVTSCKQLNHWQFEDMLSICEAYGWRCPGKDPDHFRKLVASRGDVASFAQQQAIKHLKGDLGWDGFDLVGMLEKITGRKITSVVQLYPQEAGKVIEALKAILSRKTGTDYKNLNEIKDDFRRESQDGKETSQIE